VKLLFDENLSPQLVGALADLFPRSQHVHAAGLGRSTDDAIWGYAREQGLAIVSKDSDFHERALLRGYPPKVVWIRRGNCATGEIEEMLRMHVSDLEKLESDPHAAFLIML